MVQRRTTARYTVEEYLAWDEPRQVLRDAIGPDLSLPALVRAMMDSGESCDAVASFVECVIYQKEIAERERERAEALGTVTETDRADRTGPRLDRRLRRLRNDIADSTVT